MPSSGDSSTRSTPTREKLQATVTLFNTDVFTKQFYLRIIVAWGKKHEGHTFI